MVYPLVYLSPKMILSAVFKSPIKSYRNKQKRAETQCFHPKKVGADSQIRTGDLILTKDALYLLSYISKYYAPYRRGIVATEKGLEPSTSGVTGRRSNQLNHSATAMTI